MNTGGGQLEIGFSQSLAGAKMPPPLICLPPRYLHSAPRQPVFVKVEGWEAFGSPFLPLALGTWQGAFTPPHTCDSCSWRPGSRVKVILAQSCTVQPWAVRPEPWPFLPAGQKSQKAESRVLTCVCPLNRAGAGDTEAPGWETGPNIRYPTTSSPCLKVAV